MSSTETQALAPQTAAPASNSPRTDSVSRNHHGHGHIVSEIEESSNASVLTTTAFIPVGPPAFVAPLCPSTGLCLSSTVDCASTLFLCEQPHYLERFRKCESYLCCTPNSYDEHWCCFDESQLLAFATAAQPPRSTLREPSRLHPTLAEGSAPLPAGAQSSSLSPVYCFCCQHADCGEERSGVPPCYCWTSILAPALFIIPLRACFHLSCCVPECVYYCVHQPEHREQFRSRYGITEERRCAPCVAFCCFSLAQQQLLREQALRPAPPKQVMKSVGSDQRIASDTRPVRSESPTAEAQVPIAEEDEERQLRQ